MLKLWLLQHSSLIGSFDLAAVERRFATIERRDETLPLLQRQREELLHARLLLARGKALPR